MKPIIRWRGTCATCGETVSGGGYGLVLPMPGEPVYCVLCGPGTGETMTREPEPDETELEEMEAELGEVYLQIDAIPLDDLFDTDDAPAEVPA